MKSISVQYQELKEGRMTQHQFLRNARMLFPNHVTNHNSFEDSVKILKNRGLLNEGNAVKGTPDKAPSYDYPTQPGKYMKVVQEPEVDEQDGIYPATTLTDIPKEEVSKPIKSKNRPDGLEPAKDKDKKNEMKKIRIVKESKKNLTESNVTREQIQKKYNEMFGKNPQTTFDDVAKALGISEQDIAIALFAPSLPKSLREEDEYAELEAMIAKAKEEEAGKYTKFDDFEGGLSESDKDDVAKKAVEKLSKEELDALWKAWEKRGEKTFAGILPAGSEIDMKRDRLRETIKSLVNKVLNEYERGDENDNPPSVRGVINILVNDMIDRIESNDIDLEFSSKDVEDLLNNFQDTIGHRYRDEQYENIVDGVIDMLKKKGYNIK
jgi:hypothetical protein